jgi:hypothetical protein
MAKRKRPPASGDPDIDIFQNTRFETAIARATGSAEATQEAPPEPRSDEGASAVLAVPRGTAGPEASSESAAEAPQEQNAPKPDQLAQPATKVAPGPAQAPEPNVAIKFRVPRGLKTQFMTFKAELSAALGGVSLDDSNIARPLLEEFLVEYRERILEAAQAFEDSLVRPRNGDAVGMAEFDHTIGELFKQARKRRGPTKAR